MSDLALRVTRTITFAVLGVAAILTMPRIVDRVTDSVVRLTRSDESECRVMGEADFRRRVDALPRGVYGTR